MIGRHADAGSIPAASTILTFDDALLSTCHTGAILDIAFPKGVDTVFGTCGEDGIRIWSDVDKMGGKEVLHVPGPPHAQANCLLFSQDGKSMISGWSDGCIRSHTPQSGKLLYSITVCIIHIQYFPRDMMSGGKNGQLRTWKIKVQTCSNLF